MNANKYSKDARRLILDMHARGKVPILEGGSTFYIRHLFYANLDGDQLISNELQKESRLMAREIIKQDGNDYNITFKRLIALASKPELELNVEELSWLEGRNDFYRLETQLTKVLAMLKSKTSASEL
jgi:hypothetical protein